MHVSTDLSAVRIPVILLLLNTTTIGLLLIAAYYYCGELALCCRISSLWLVPWLEFGGGDAEQKPWLEEKWGFPAELFSESAKPGFCGFFFARNGLFW